MKIKQKLIYLLFALFICQSDLAASSPTNLVFLQNDTIPDISTNYTGNRIQVKSIKVVKKRGKSVKIEYKLINTGRNKIRLGKVKPLPKNLIVEFDETLEANGLADAKDIIIENLKKQKISIRPGQLIMSNKMKFNFIPIAPDERIAKSESQPIKNDSLENKIPSFEDFAEPIKESYPDEILSSEDSVINYIDSTHLAQQNLDSLSSTISIQEDAKVPSKNSIEQSVDFETLDETILVNENKNEESKEKDVEFSALPSIKEKIEIVDLEKVLNPDQKIQSKLNQKEEQLALEKIKPTFSTDSTAIAEAIEQDINLEKPVVQTQDSPNVVEVIQEEIAVIESTIEYKDSTTSTEIEQVEVAKASPPEDLLKIKQCADLIIQDFEIVKKNKRNITVKFTIVNIGNHPIAIFGATKKDNDNVSIEAYYTRSHKLTRGSIPIKSFVIKKGLKNKQGILNPGESFSQKIKIDKSKMTKFTPVIALSLNPHSLIPECNKANNSAFVTAANEAPTSKNLIPVKPNLLEANEEIIGVNNLENK